MVGNRGQSPISKTYRLGIFDFDGTLADSFAFFLGVFNQLAAKHGFSPVDETDIARLRALDARQMMAHVGLPAWKLPAVTKDFITHMRANRDRVRLFDGIAEALRALHANGVALAVVSSNARDIVLHVLGPDTARLVRHYECGVSMFGKRARLRKALRKCGVPREEAIYVADQATDLEAARAEGIAFGAVAWGYGDFQSLRKLAPEAAFATVGELRTLCA
jgi:phosphoglycolate phosphatase